MYITTIDTHILPSTCALISIYIAPNGLTAHVLSGDPMVIGAIPHFGIFYIILRDFFSSVKKQSLGV